MYYFSSGTRNLHKTYKVNGRHAVLLTILTKSSVRLPPPGWLSWKSGAGVLHNTHSLSCTTPAPPTTSFLSSKPSLALTDKKNSTCPSLVPIQMGPLSSGTGLCPTGWSLQYSRVQPVQCSASQPWAVRVPKDSHIISLDDKPAPEHAGGVTTKERPLLGDIQLPVAIHGHRLDF